MDRCPLCSSSCELLEHETWAGTLHSACTHGACEACLRQWIDRELPRCCREGQLRVQCFAADCPKLIPQTLVLHVSLAARQVAEEIEAGPPARESEPVAQDAPCWDRCLELARLRNLAARAGSGLAAHRHRAQTLGEEHALTCNFCGEDTVALISNPACGHAACAMCWTRRAKAQINSPDAEGPACITCVEASCATPISWGLLSCICIRYSEAVRCFVVEQDAQVRDAEVQRVLKQRPEGVPAETFKACGVCHEPRASLLCCAPCQHSACEECWLSWTESSLPQCRDKCQARPGCLVPGCPHTISSPLWSHFCARSPVVAAFHNRVESVMSRHRKIASTGVRVVQAARASYPGPICSICLEPALALLQNTPCHHGACEGCWRLWAESEIPRCHSMRRDVARCFFPRCLDAMSHALWQHCCTESEQVQSFSKLPMVARRSRLRANALFPTGMQVDCPRPDCWGLGYLGFDTVMCFICEHQWLPEEPGTKPSDMGVEEVMGVKVKRCPSCNEYIEKNGGCDHMTCRCRHEFHWSTLKPYQ
mmetsp:Transcript_30427/g.87232  ORF Transcript_30427/g.87232 Transcript_30427/m.87232 type:complete len:538 (-) Transcript_30427:105-1718(-)